MPSRGRPLNPDLIATRKLYLPATLCGRVEAELWDPIRNKRRYGTLSKLIAELLEDWIHRKTGEATYPTMERTQDV